MLSSWLTTSCRLLCQLLSRNEQERRPFSFFPVPVGLQVEVGSANEALVVLRRGSRLRQRAETGLNYSSSRSHSIFTVRHLEAHLCIQPASRPAGHCIGDCGVARSRGYS
jgi:hypothetical protein